MNAAWVERARALEAARDALLEEARAVGREALGIEVLDLRPGPDGTWEAVLRFPGRAVPDPRADSAAAGVGAAGEARGWTVPEPPEPPFRSPVRASAPCEGDGTGDLETLIAHADTAVALPPAEHPGVDSPLPLDDPTRARMLASTMAGDAVLALMHEGRGDDPASLAAALRQSRDRYAAEVGRMGLDPDLELFGAAAESAALLIAEAA